MSLNEYADFVFRAGMLHLPDPPAAWREVTGGSPPGRLARRHP